MALPWEEMNGGYDEWIISSSYEFSHEECEGEYDDDIHQDDVVDDDVPD